MTADGNRRHLLAAFEELDGARGRLIERLENMAGETQAFRDHLASGGSISVVYLDRAAQERRDALFEAMAEFDRAMTRARIRSVRTMVDDEGMSLSEVARLVSRSRQFVTRLYRAADDVAENATES